MSNFSKRILRDHVKSMNCPRIWHYKSIIVGAGNFVKWGVISNIFSYHYLSITLPLMIFLLKYHIKFFYRLHFFGLDFLCMCQNFHILFKLNYLLCRRKGLNVLEILVVWFRVFSAILPGASAKPIAEFYTAALALAPSLQKIQYRHLNLDRK